MNYELIPRFFFLTTYFSLLVTPLFVSHLSFLCFFFFAAAKALLFVQIDFVVLTFYGKNKLQTKRKEEGGTDFTKKKHTMNNGQWVEENKEALCERKKKLWLKNEKKNENVVFFSLKAFIMNEYFKYQHFCILS